MNRPLITLTFLLQLNSLFVSNEVVANELSELIQMVNHLPKITNAVSSQQSCNNPPITLTDRRSFARFACTASPAAVEAVLRSDPDSDLNLLMLCGRTCNTTQLRSVINEYRLETRPNSTPGTALPPLAEWSPEGRPRIPADQLFGANSSMGTCLVRQATFTGANRRIDYLGTQHFYTFPTQDSSTRTRAMTILDDTFRDARPTAVVLEGYPESFPCERAVELYLTNNNELSSEQDIIARLALQSGARVYGGDPENFGLTGPNTTGLQILQEIAQRVGPRSEGQLPSLEAILTEVIPLLRHELGGQMTISTAEEFRTWYRSFNGVEFSLQTSYRDITPAENLPAHLVRESNRAYSAASVMRDTTALRIIRRAALHSERVMVVYGVGHLERTTPVLSSVLTATTTPIAPCREVTP